MILIITITVVVYIRIIILNNLDVLLLYFTIHCNMMCGHNTSQFIITPS